MLLASFPTCELEARIADSIDFIVRHFEILSQEEVAARMTLNCSVGPLQASDLPLDHSKITIIDANDDVVINETLRDQLIKMYPGAHLGMMKTGGNFPYLSRPEDFNMHLEVHLRRMKYYRPGVDDAVDTSGGSYGVAGVAESIGIGVPAVAGSKSEAGKKGKKDKM